MTKDVVACEKLRGAGKQALIRRYPNGETQLAKANYQITWSEVVVSKTLYESFGGEQFGPGHDGPGVRPLDSVVTRSHPLFYIGQIFCT